MFSAVLTNAATQGAIKLLEIPSITLVTYMSA
jgi:hypothetical protein